MDHAEIAKLYEADGPFVSVYLESLSGVEDAAPRLELRWKNVRRELADDGAPDADLAAIDAVVAETGHPGGDTLVVIAAGGEVRFAGHLTDPPQPELGRVAPLPVVTPLLQARQGMVSHVVVLADRSGADLVAFAADASIETQNVDGDDQVARSAPGGWSQRRFQQRAENTWESNAKGVVEETAKLAASVDAQLVLVAGDVRAVQLFTDHLPGELEPITQVLEHGARGADGGIDAAADDIRRAVHTVAANRTVEVLREFKEEAGQHDRAADGHARTVEALQRAQVETLLVSFDPDDDRTAWFGPQPVHVATERQTIVDMGVDDPQEGPLVELLVRAAVCTGAAVCVVPGAGGPTGGVGAVLRHTGTAPG